MHKKKNSKIPQLIVISIDSLTLKCNNKQTEIPIRFWGDIFGDFLLEGDREEEGEALCFTVRVTVSVFLFAIFFALDGFLIELL